MGQVIPEVSRNDIVRGLCGLGIGPGQRLVVHASLSSFGRVRGGPESVIEALMQVLTPSGTLLMPSFNHGAPFEAGGPGWYDPLETPTANGAIADAFWRLPGVHRSLDPTHAFAGWGEGAERYLEGHHRTLTMGPESPLGLLLRDGGWGLLMGVDYRVNTFHHVVEVMTGAPCLGKRTERYPVRLADGRLVEGRTWGWRAARCPLTGAGGYGEELAARGLERRGVVGLSTLRLFRLSDCFELVARLLRDGAPGAPPCRHCPVRPRRVAATVPSDWDEARGQLKRD
jgi:aminoglycoside N3'-acetyltransferase